MAGQTLSFGSSEEAINVLDVKFVDDKQLMFLLREGGKI